MTENKGLDERTVPVGAVAVSVEDGKAWLVVGGPTTELIAGLAPEVCEVLANHLSIVAREMRRAGADAGLAFAPLKAAGMAETRPGGAAEDEQTDGDGP